MIDELPGGDNTRVHTDAAGIDKLTKALILASLEIQHAIKDSRNPHFKSEFASLNAVLDAVRPVWAKYGLAFTQWPGMADGLVTLTTVVSHESGQWMSGIASSPLSKKDAQGVGSAITYLRRYALAAIAGIGQVDDDGEAAAGAPTITEEQVANLEDWIAEVGANREGFLTFLGVSQLADLPADRYNAALDALKAKAGK